MSGAKLHSELTRRLSDPVSRRPLLLADAGAFERALDAVSRLEGAVHAAWREGAGPEAVLLTDDGRTAYPVVAGMPVLLPEAGVPL